MPTKTVLFLCTGNYYRSRFAEYYFQHLATESGLDWAADSRGLALDPFNPGPISVHTREECVRLGVVVDAERYPQDAAECDFTRATLVIAVKEQEHRPLMRRRFPHWENRIEYWAVHDLDVEPARMALPVLKRQVEELIERLKQTATERSA